MFEDSFINDGLCFFISFSIYVWMSHDFLTICFFQYFVVQNGCAKRQTLCLLFWKIRVPNVNPIMLQCLLMFDVAIRCIEWFEIILSVLFRSPCVLLCNSYVKLKSKIQHGNQKTTEWLHLLVCLFATVTAGLINLLNSKTIFWMTKTIAITILSKSSCARMFCLWIKTNN